MKEVIKVVGMYKHRLIGQDEKGDIYVASLILDSYSVDWIKFGQTMTEVEWSKGDSDGDS